MCLLFLSTVTLSCAPLFLCLSLHFVKLLKLTSPSVAFSLPKLIATHLHVFLPLPGRPVCPVLPELHYELHYALPVVPCGGSLAPRPAELSALVLPLPWLPLRLHSAPTSSPNHLLPPGSLVHCRPDSCQTSPGQPRAPLPFWGPPVPGAAPLSSVSPHSRSRGLACPSPHALLHACRGCTSPSHVLGSASFHGPSLTFRHHVSVALIPGLSRDPHTLAPPLPRHSP